MPVQRPRSAAIGGAAQAAAAGPLPPPGKISAHAFRVEKKGQYQGELNVPSILFIGKAGEPADRSLAKQKRGELSKYKLRPGALEELDIEVDAEEEQDFDASLPRAGGATSPKKKSVSYDMAPYGGKREMDSLRKQIVETETAALESRIQSQMVMSKTKSTVSMVEEKVGHVRESNQQLDSELVEIEKQIEELKRISRSQIDEIKTLRESNKHKETKLHSEQQNLERMEGSVRDSMLIAQEAKEQEKLNKPSAGAAQNREQTSRAGPGAGDAPGAGAGAGAGTGSGPGQPRVAGASASGAAAGPGPSFESGSGEPAYKGDKGEKPADHPEIQCLLELGDHLGQTDGRVWSQGGERRDKEQHFLALHASEDYVQVPPWLASSKPPSDWAENKGSRKLGFQACNVDLPRTDLEIEHVYGFSGSWSVDAMSCTATGKLVYPAASLCVINDVAHSRQRFFGGHSDGVLCLALHADGRMVASGDVGKSSKVLVWDSEEPELPPAVSLWGFHQAGIGGLSFSRDGNKLVTVISHTLDFAPPLLRTYPLDRVIASLVCIRALVN
jgi:WD40 repeat protein